jgi:hypothetical protein
MRRFLAILLLISLIGCATPIKPIPIITPNVINLDARSLESCSPLLQQGLSASFEDLLVTDIANIELYTDCKNKQENSIKLLKEFANKSGVK